MAGFGLGDDAVVEVTALAINVSVPEWLQWHDTRRGEEFVLTSINVRLLPDGHVAAKAYGRPLAGGRGGDACQRALGGAPRAVTEKARETGEHAPWRTRLGVSVSG